MNDPQTPNFVEPKLSVNGPRLNALAASIQTIAHPTKAPTGAIKTGYEDKPDDTPDEPEVTPEVTPEPESMLDKTRKLFQSQQVK